MWAPMLGTLLLLVAMATCQASHNSVVEMSMPRDDDRGVVQNCGPQGFPFSMYWEPKDLNPEGKVTLYYNVTAPEPFQKGKGVLKLYLMDVEQPIVELDQNMDCPSIKHTAPMVPCPIKKGDQIVGKVEERKLDPLAGYKGQYRVEISLTNQAGKVVICGNMTVTVL